VLGVVDVAASYEQVYRGSNMVPVFSALDELVNRYVHRWSPRSLLESIGSPLPARRAARPFHARRSALDAVAPAAGGTTRGPVAPTKVAR
jgi:hypothetical protein